MNEKKDRVIHISSTSLIRMNLITESENPALKLKQAAEAYARGAALNYLDHFLKHNPGFPATSGAMLNRIFKEPK